MPYIYDPKIQDLTERLIKECQKNGFNMYLLLDQDCNKEQDPWVVRSVGYGLDTLKAMTRSVVAEAISMGPDEIASSDSKWLQECCSEARRVEGQLYHEAPKRDD